MLNHEREDQCHLYEQMELIGNEQPDRSSPWLRHWFHTLKRFWQSWLQQFNHRPCYFVQRPDNSWWGVYLAQDTQTFRRSSDREVRAWLEAVYQLTAQRSAC